MALGELGEAVAAEAGLDRVGEEHGVVGGRERDALAGEQLGGVLDVVAELQDRGVGQHGGEHAEDSVEGELALGAARAEQVGLARGMGGGDISGLARGGGERDAADARLHRVGAVGGDVERQRAGLVGGGDQRGELGQVADRGVGLGVHRRHGADGAGGPALARLFGMGGRRLGRAHGRGGAERRRDAVGQRAELHRDEEGEELVLVGRVELELVEAMLDGNVPVEGDEGAAEADLVGVVDERLTALGLLDLVGAGQQRLEVAILADQLGGGLDPDARGAGDVVDRVARQRLDVDHLVGEHAELGEDLVGADGRVLHRVEHLDTGPDELHQVLVRADDGDLGASVAGLGRIGGDQVVGLETLHLDAGQAPGAHSVADEAELRDQVVRRLGAVGLVAVEHLVAERVRGGVENDGEMRRPLGAEARDHLVQHAAEAGDRADRQAIGGAGQRRQRVVGPEDIGRAVDQIEMMALADAHARLPAPGRPGRP